MTLPIPSLPTDNLYKFIALFGLATVLLASYGLRDLSRQNARREESLLEIGADSAVTRARVLYQRRIDTRSAARLRQGAQDLASPQIESVVEYPPPDTAAVRRKWLAIQTRREIQETQSDIVWLYWLNGIGFVMIVSGFTAWWFLVQRYHDRVLRREAEGIQTPDRP